MMEEFTKASTSAGFEYLTDAHTYVDHVANLQVRNVCIIFLVTCQPRTTPIDTVLSMVHGLNNEPFIIKSMVWLHL